MFGTVAMFRYHLGYTADKADKCDLFLKQHLLPIAT
jgi:hypothetical protein